MTNAEAFLALVGGISMLGCGWFRLWRCSGWWPDDRSDVIWGLSLFLIGAGVSAFGFWGIISHVLG